MSTGRILAIDPGPVQSAYVIWDGSTVEDHGILENENIIRTLGTGRRIDHAVIEMIASYGMPVGAEVFETCVWIGRFIERWNEYNPGYPQSLSRIPRKDIKLHLCGTVKAKDSNIRQALIDRLGAPGVKAKPGVTYGVKADEWAALAVAVTVFDRLNIGLRGAA